MKQKLKIGRGFTLVELLVVIVIIAALAGLTAPMVIRQRKKADQTEAVNNAKQIGLAMFEFDAAYGSYPSQTTAESFPEATIGALFGTNSNDFFRQFIASEISSSETMFYAKANYTKKPDNVYNASGKALAPREVGFGYIMNGDVAFSSSGNPSRVLAVAPLAGSTTPASDGTFDLETYDSKAVVLRIDNSVQSLNVQKTSKKAQLNNTAPIKYLLDTGADSIWGEGVTPSIKVPSVQ
jgi:prepilin-type N-terminal cleavage/methylation domain-containing protein